MISPPNYALFCIGALALIVSPGPDFFYVLSRGLALGARAGLFSALGIAAGLVIHTLLAASGLTLLLLASDAAFNVVKWLGAAYLIWMGIQTLRAQTAIFQKTEVSALPHRVVFRQGFLTNVFNPKVALTFAAFLPAFVNSKSENASFQIAFLGLTLCTLALGWFCLIGTLAGRIRHFLARQPKFGRAVQTVSGIILTLLGARLAFVQR